MQALRLPAARGWYWIARGWRLYRRNPPLLILLALNYWTMLFLISLVPLIGPIAANVMQQALSVTVMNGCRAIDEGTKVGVDIVWSGLRRNLPTLLKLGGLYLLAELAIAGISVTVSGTSLTDVLGVAGSTRTSKPADVSLLPLLYTALALNVPLILAFWFAPILAAWHNTSAPKSVFFSAVAALRNWRAFALYGMSVIVLIIVLLGLMRAMTGFSDAAATTGSLVATMLMVLVLMPTLFASVYVSYREIFAASQGDGGGR
jgi:hypothetical protein